MLQLFDELVESNILETRSLESLVASVDGLKEKAHKLYRNQPSPSMPSIRSKHGKKYKALKEEQTKALKDWETHMNTLSKGYDKAPLFVENKVDLTGPPENFIYINERKPTENVFIPDEPLIGCDCEDCYVDR